MTTKTETLKAVELETWENSTAGRVVLDKFNQLGALVPEMIGGHRTFHISPQERRINQEKAATPEQDVFQNGICQPIVVDETDPKARELLANPNVLNEAAMKALFQATTADLTARLESITHVAVLNRLLAMSEEVDSTMSQNRAIMARLDAVAPLLHTEITSASVDALEGRRPAAVSPR